MRIRDLRDGSCFNLGLWMRETNDNHIGSHFFVKEVMAKTEHGYVITFERCDLEMLHDVIALFDAHDNVIVV